MHRAIDVDPRDGSSTQLPAPASDHMVSAGQSSSARWSNGHYREIETSLDAEAEALWVRWRPRASASFTPVLLHDLNAFYHDMQSAFASSAPPSFKFILGASDIPGIFNMGGDLAHFLDCIRKQDRASLLTYAHNCVDAIYTTSFTETPLLTVGIVEGDALGGGFEAALAFHVLIVEKGVKMGFPEVLFNSFPGMGAFSLLARKLGQSRAHKMIMGGETYSSEQIYEMGLIDILAEKGKARETALQYVHDNVKHHSQLLAVQRVWREVNRLSREELRAVTTIWVEAALQIAPADQRRMDILVAAQKRRLNGLTSLKVNFQA